ncbi:hypothetical protein [Methylocystis sp.]|uniref:hypothetical protein n=1 Tax=Methylocystis sp. TaxID=1911079 RepID=UPI003DA38651
MAVTSPRRSPNLHRSDLDRLERAEQIGEFDRLRKQVEAREGVAIRHVQVEQGGRNKKGHAKAARRLATKFGAPAEPRIAQTNHLKISYL